jgi:hypothetical protein
MAQNEAGEYLRDRHCRDQWADTDDVHDAFEIVGQYVQRHFCADPFHGLHLEVCLAHPGFDGTEGMFNRFTPLTHFLRMLIETTLNVLKNVFVFPTGDAAFLARGAFFFDSASRAGVGPVAAQSQPSFLVCRVVD